MSAPAWSRQLPPPALRTLPLTTKLHAGQTLESYVEAVAHQHQVPPRIIMCRVGFDFDARSHLLLSDVDDVVLSNLSQITRTSTEQLHRATLDYYASNGLIGKEHRGELLARETGSRFCPRCLIESPTVWQQRWHLNWTFACLRHRRLLEDCCRVCGHPPRSTENRRTLPLDPWRCHNRVAAATGRNQPCNTDLGGTARDTLHPDHPVLRCQRIVFDLIGSPTRAASAEVRLCGIAVPTRDALAAMSFLIRRATVAGYEIGDAVAHHLGAPRRIGMTYTPDNDDSPQARLVQAARSATAMAGYATAAADVLSAPTLARAAEALERFDDSAHGTPPPLLEERFGYINRDHAWRSAEDRFQSRRPSKLIDAIEIVARSPGFTPAQHLSFRTANRIPRFPIDPHTRGIPWPHTRRELVSAREVPQVLWPAATYLLPRATHKDTGALEVTAAMMMLRMGSFQRWNPIALHLALPATFARTAHSVLAKLAKNEMLTETVYVLDGLVDAIANQHPPIDYARRRWIFRELTHPGRGWRRACNDADIIATERRRRFMGHALFELLTGSDARLRSHMPIPAGEERTAYKSFMKTERSHLDTALRIEAERLLLRHRIDEPIDWSPDFDPGTGRWHTDPGDVHRLLAGWNTASRRDSMRQSSRDHTGKILQTVIDSELFPRVMNDIHKFHDSGKLYGPLAFIAVKDMYVVDDGGWTFGASGQTLLENLRHTFTGTFDLEHWDNILDPGIPDNCNSEIEQTPYLQAI